MLLQDDPSTELSKGIYQNNSKSRLYRDVAIAPILPCLDVIEWLTQNIDHQRRTLLDFEGKHVASYQAPLLNHMYQFKES